MSENTDEARKPSSHLHFDGMSWPNPLDPNEVIWQAKYGDSDSVRHAVASFASAYQALVWMPQRRRNEIIASIRRATASSASSSAVVSGTTVKEQQ